MSKLPAVPDRARERNISEALIQPFMCDQNTGLITPKEGWTRLSMPAFGEQLLFTSTLAGWAGTPTQDVRIELVGDLLYFWATLSGTCQASATSMTLPYNAAGTANKYYTFAVPMLIDGTQVPAGYGRIATGSDVLTFYKSGGSTIWESTGTKTIEIFGVLPVEL